MKLLVGLGNPGPKYETTRHNAGFLVLDQVCDKHNLQWAGQKFSSEFAKGSIEGVSCICLKPQTFMNLSGRAVREATRFFKIAVEDIIVLHDDIDLPAGRVKARRGGGHGGHNGIRSIVSELGSGDFQRIKLGVGRPEGGPEVSDWVLGGFTDDELAQLAGVMTDEVYVRLKQFLTE